MFTAEYISSCLPEHKDEFRPGWYISSDEGDDWYWFFDNTPFARKQDVECAIRALARNGITTGSQLDEISEVEMRRICCDGLMW